MLLEASIPLRNHHFTQRLHQHPEIKWSGIWIFRAVSDVYIQRLHLHDKFTLRFTKLRLDEWSLDNDWNNEKWWDIWMNRWVLMCKANERVFWECAWVNVCVCSCSLKRLFSENSTRCKVWESKLSAWYLKYKMQREFMKTAISMFSLWESVILDTKNIFFFLFRKKSKKVKNE